MRLLLDFIVNMQKFNGCSFTYLFSLVGSSINPVFIRLSFEQLHSFRVIVLFRSLLKSLWVVWKADTRGRKFVLAHFRDLVLEDYFGWIVPMIFRLFLVSLVIKRIKCFPIYLGNVIFNRVLIVKFSGYLCYMDVGGGLCRKSCNVGGGLWVPYSIFSWITLNTKESIPVYSVSFCSYITIVTRINSHAKYLIGSAIADQSKFCIFDPNIVLHFFT